MSDVLKWLFTGMPIVLTAVLWGIGTGVLSAALVRRAFRAESIAIQREPVIWGVVGAVLGGVFVVSYVSWGCQVIPVVTPDPVWKYGRIVYHLVLIALLVAATAIDVRDYTIPDAITVPGMIVGLLGAGLSGDLQTMHLWIDWNQEIEQLAGPYIPEWIRMHHHWHGIAWSVVGLLVGGAVTWITRVISGRLLGQEALGFGDVTLMAMIGSFLGWQPVAIVFLLAPFTAIVIGVLVRFVSGKSYVPYGPFLSLSAWIVIVLWRWIWMFETSDPSGRGIKFSVRRFYGDWQLLLITAGVTFGGTLLLLFLLRMYRSIPVEVLTRQQAEAGESTARGGSRDGAPTGKNG